MCARIGGRSEVVLAACGAMFVCGSGYGVEGGADPSYFAVVVVGSMRGENREG